MAIKTIPLKILVFLPFVIANPNLGAEAPLGTATTVGVTQPEEKPRRKYKTGLVLEEVVVTASKREEPFRVVPSSISVMTGDDLEKIGASDFLDFMEHLPNVSTESGGKGASKVVIRGVNSGAITNPTGIYVDETPIGSSTAHAVGNASVDFVPLDLERIEVLAGPQGTLYGSGAMGGLLKYVTRDPNSRAWEAMAQYEESRINHGSDSSIVQASVNIPLSANIAAIRMSGFQEDFGGYIDNPRRGIEDQNKSETEAHRISLLFNLPSDIRIQLTNIDQVIDRVANPMSDRDGETGKPTGGDLQDNSTFLDEIWVSVFRMNVMELGWDLGEVSVFGLDLGNIDFISNTALHEQKLRFTIDETRLFGAIFGTGEDVQWFVEDRVKIDKVTQEIRFTANTDWKLDWQVGAYYAYEDSHQYLLLTDVGNTFLESNGLSPVSEGATNTFIPSPSELTMGGLTGVQVFEGDLFAEYKEIAGFANVTYSFTEKFDITVGYRWGKIDQDYIQEFSGLLGNPRNPSEPNRDTGSTTHIVKNYLVNPRYFLTDDIMFYFRAADGFRAGGPNFIIRDTVTNEPVQPNDTVDPDELKNFELGAKMAFFDDRLTVDIAGYTIRWQDIQLLATRNGTNNLENGGDARIDGAEVTTRVQPLSWLAITGSAMISDARLVEESPGIGAEEGARLEASPKFASSVLVDTYFNLADWLSLTAGLTYSFTGERTSGFQGSEIKRLYELPQYEVYGARVVFGFPYADLTLFIKNIKDERGQISARAQEFREDPSLPVRAVINQPRTIGAAIKLTY